MDEVVPEFQTLVHKINSIDNAYLKGLVWRKYSHNLRMRSQYDSALFYLTKIENLDFEEGPYCNICMQKTALGHVYLGMRDFKNLQSNAYVSLQECERVEDKYGIYTSLYHLTANFLAHNQLDSFQKYRDIFFKKVDIKNMKPSMAVYHHSMLFLYDDLLTEENLKEIAHITGTNDSLSLGVVYSVLSELVFNKNRFQDALDYSNKCLALDIPLPYKQKAAEVRHQALLELNNNIAAYNALKDYNKINEEILSQDRKYEYDNLQVLYETEKKEKEIAEKSAKIEQINQQRLLWFLISVFGLILALMIFLLMKQRLFKNQMLAAQETYKQKQQINNLRKQQKILAMDYMLQGQESERKRIAQDLHDGLGGLLTSARLQIKQIEKEIEKLHAFNLFEKADKLINKATHEVRRIAHEMMPGSLDDLGLIASIEDLAIHIVEDTGINVQLELPEEDILLDQHINVNVYRVTQEILNNALKYSEAKHVIIMVQYDSELIRIFISDDGKGFVLDDSVLDNGLGLKSIRSRIQYLNGSMDIKTAPNEGTSYEIEIPIQNSNN